MALLRKVLGGNVEEIAVEEAIARTAAGEQLVDVREPSEWRQGHPLGALNIPLNELDVRKNEIDKNRPVMVICASGMRSQRGTAILNSVGYDAVSVRGGFSGWVSLDGPRE
ncbi:MAG: rhodanese-like domain-containing protein [Varibaculum sp.]|nr:rhodanese-like domain-containing protein [Varibaculum sp.]